MTKAIETAIKLLETLPEPTQEHLVDEDEARWDEQFAQDSALKAAARKAREALARGEASDMDFDKP